MSAATFREPIMEVVGGRKPFTGTYWQCVDHISAHGGYVRTGLGRQPVDPDHYVDVAREQRA